MGNGKVAPAPVMVWACAVMVMLASMAAMIYLINLESPIRKCDRTRKYLVTVILQYYDTAASYDRHEVVAENFPGSLP